MNRFRSLFFTLLVAVSAVSAQTGSVSGQIRSKEGFALPGAAVILRGTGVGTATDINGQFTFVRVPTGPQELAVSYLGYAPQSVAVSVEAGRTVDVRIELEPTVIEGKEVFITGERIESQARAFNRQKQNFNITNVIAADQIGRFPDANIGDALKRVTGITVQYDQGEARFGTIRGTAPELSSVMINGERIPSAEAERRAVQLDLIPSDMISTIEVNKAVLPDMDGDAIGGSINLHTRTAPDQLRVSVTSGGGTNFIRSLPIWTGSAVVGQRLLDGSLGMIFSGSIHDNHFGSDNVEGVWTTGTSGQIYPSVWEVRRYDLRRLRQSLSAAFDYQLSPGHTLMLSGLYNNRKDWENRYRLRFLINNEPVAGVTQHGAARNEIRRQVKGGDTHVDNARLEDQTTSRYSLGGQHLFADLVKADWSLSYSTASEDRPNERYAQFRVRSSASLPLPMTVNLSNLREPQITPTNAADVALTNFGFHELTEEFQWTEEKDLGFRFNVEFPVIQEGEYRNTVKVGGAYKAKDKTRNNDFYEYAPVGVSTTAFNLGSTYVDVWDVSRSDFEAGPYASGFFATKFWLGSQPLGDASRWAGSQVQEERAVNFDASETVTSGYAMIAQNIGDQLRIVAGARVEMTSYEGTGRQYDADNDLLSTVAGSGDYTNVLPGVHARYQLDPVTVVRAAWSNTIARPRYFDLVPARVVNVSDSELFLGNPGLKPTTSMNFDVMGERYFESIGIVSAGVFYKSIDNFIYTQATSNYADPVSATVFSTMFQPKNLGAATLFGFEAGVQRRLDFLPSVLSNLSVYANYTYTDSETDNPVDIAAGAATIGKIDLPGTATHLMNLSLSYNTGFITASVSYNYASSYIDPDELDLTPGLERYYDATQYLDVNLSVHVLPQLRFFVEANNLLNQPLRYYAGTVDRTYQQEFYGSRITTGLKFDL